MHKRQCLVDGVHDEGVSNNSFLQSSILLTIQQVLVGNSDVYFA
jgi:hypothetical protein